VGRFVIRARLGSGGMGEVYRADDTKLKRSVALKRMSPKLRTDEHYRQRFLKEAERASSLSDQRIASIYDVLEENGETFLVMEYVEGSTLRSRLTQPLSLEEFLPLAIQCAEALVAAHEKGIIHRDIKPENIMLTPKGQVKILDFGVAKRLVRPADPDATASTVSQPGTLSGTPAYMAPEVLLEKESDARADIFSLGIVCYEMLTAQHPFRADSFLATSDRILRETPIPLSKLNSRVPERLERIVSTMLAKKPDDRYASAADLVADLRAVGGEAAGPRRFTSQLLRPAYLRVAAVIAALAVIATLVLLATVPGLQKGIKRRLGFAVVPEQKLLVVLPFSALGGGEEAAAFGKGLIETLNVGLTKLTERHSLQVVPASDVRARGVTTIDQARREFGANLVIEGSLQIAAETDRVTYAVVDANTHRQLRAATITAGAANPFAVQDQVVTSVLDALDITLQPRERTVLAAYGTTEPAAYNSYLRGRGYLQDYPKPENVESAIAAFKQSLEKDPQYALAYAGIGEAYWYKYQQTKEPQWVGEALAACERAVALRAELSDGHTCLGVVYNGTGKHELAIEQFRRAVEREPTSDAAHRGLALAYQQSGLLKEAEETYRRAIALRPQYWAGYNWLGNFYFLTGRYVKAEQMFKKVIEFAPENHRGYDNVGVTEYMLGSWAEAEQAYKKSVTLHESSETYSNLGALYFFQGRYADAARMFEAGVRLSPRNPFVRGNLADAYRWIPGEAKKAEENFRQAIELGEQELQINPRDAEIVANIALWRAKTGFQAEAVRDIEKALTSAPADPRYMYYGAVVYKLAGNRPRALEWLKKSVAHGYLVREIRADPEMRDLHDNPVFQRIVGTVQQ